MYYGRFCGNFIVCPKFEHTSYHIINVFFSSDKEHCEHDCESYLIREGKMNKLFNMFHSTYVSL